MPPSDSAQPVLQPDAILVHYDEIALKGGNRTWFENRLMRNLRAALKPLGATTVARMYGRVRVDLGADVSVDAASGHIGRVFGVSRYSPSMRLPLDREAVAENLDALVERLLAEIDSGARSAPASFAIVTHRANKDLPFTSVDVNRELGARVVDRTGWKVQLDRPELEFHVYFVEKHAYLALERLAGPGGLPSGSTGKVACLLSGGLDSPVASYRMLKRGAAVVFIHFHSAPHTSAASQDKVRELATHVLAPGQTARLWMVPFAPTQQKIITDCPPPLRVILYRRYMMRAAEAIALRAGALALVTGDSLGQVASQTLENLNTISRVVTLPVLRPLVGMHKAEIIDDARRIGCYETSIEPHDDCCSYLMPRNPATRSTPEALDRAEEALDTDAEVAALVEAAELETILGD